MRKGLHRGGIGRLVAWEELGIQGQSLMPGPQRLCPATGPGTGRALELWATGAQPGREPAG